MKLGRWIIFGLIAFLISSSFGAYHTQQHQTQDTAQDTIFVAQAPQKVQTAGQTAGPENIKTSGTLHDGDSATLTNVWLLEFPQHWVQNGHCEVKGTLKTLLTQTDDTVFGRLHWVWNGQNDAAVFTGTMSNGTVNLHMRPPDIGGFSMTFKGKTKAFGVISGKAMATSVCRAQNGTFTLSPVLRPQRSPRTAALPLFQKPFVGEYLVSNYFDHDQPRQFVDNNGYLTTWKGDRLELGSPGAGIDGHGGYDWGLPEKTPLNAVADGVVTFAGEGTSFFCPPLERETTGNYVYILHTAPSGEQFETEYVHLNRVDVQPGDVVESGQIIGLSGNTGCSTGPHLHFGVRRILNPQTGTRTLIDPYGWETASRDPWQHSEAGAQSVWLWKTNQAPTLHEYGR